MPLKRFLLAACCALLAFSASAQHRDRVLERLKARAKPPALPECPLQPAECQINMPVFNFGRGQMNSTAPPIYGNNTVSVTCTRAHRDNLSVTVNYELLAIPPAPARQMRDNELRFLTYDMFLDPARTRYWGDGSQGTFPIIDQIFLDDRTRVGTRFHVVYGMVLGAQGATPPGQWLGLVLGRLNYHALCTGN
jgi:spore coat protein U-like protein